MNDILNRIETSFKAAMRGEELIHRLVWWWGLMGYLVAYFVIDRIIKINNIVFIDIILSLLAVAYFSWHVYVLKKCSPKKPALSKEEKKKVREDARKDFGKRMMRKLFLQEPISKWDPAFVSTIIDLFCIASFLTYLLR